MKFFPSKFIIPCSIFCGSLIFSFSLYASAISGEKPGGCEIECHKNPQLKKKEKNRLKECVVCHVNVQRFKGSEVPKVHRSKVQGSTLNVEPLNMAYIPEGEFIMGTDDRLPDEKPAHVVYLKEFYIDIYETTNEDYKKFVEHTGYSAPNNWKNGTYPEGKTRHPVILVSWYDADNYCKWAGKRLPGEREWEKAARGTDGRIYPWGNKWDMNKSNNPMLGIGDTREVGAYEEGKSPYGLYDMSGNVWEWVDDYYYPHPGSDYINPEFGDRHRLLKGGSWWDCSFYACGISAPTYNRAFFDPLVKGKSYGFRCAR